MLMRRFMTIPRFFFAVEAPQSIEGKTHGTQDISLPHSPTILQVDTLGLSSPLPPRGNAFKQ